MTSHSNPLIAESIDTFQTVTVPYETNLADELADYADSYHTIESADGWALDFYGITEYGETWNVCLIKEGY